MFAVRSIFADPPRVAREMKALAAKGLVEPWLGATDDPLGFLVHEAGAANMIEAAYRFARHEPGVDVVLFGTGDAAHLRTNVASLLKPPLPQADRAKLDGAVRPPHRHRAGWPSGAGAAIAAFSSATAIAGEGTTPVEGAQGLATRVW